MKIKRLSLSLALVLTCAVVSMAQEASKIESKYSRFDDKTLVQLDAGLVTGGKYEGIRLSAAYTCLGKASTCKPDVVLLSLVVVLKKAVYDLPGNLVVLADGERLPLGNMGRLGLPVDIMPNWKIMATFLGIKVPQATFLKIAKAKKVEMRLDVLEFELNTEHLSAFRDFASQMQP